jgi:hypothetical protein
MLVLVFVSVLTRLDKNRRIFISTKNEQLDFFHFALPERNIFVSMQKMYHLNKINLLNL